MQKDRFLISLRATESAIQKNIKLEDLHDRNETLYHRILVDHIEGAFTEQKNSWIFLRYLSILVIRRSSHRDIF